VYNYVGREQFEVSASEPLPEGRNALRYEFEPTGQPDLEVGKRAPVRAQLYIDGELVANAEFPYRTPIFFELEGLSCGHDFDAPGDRELSAAVHVRGHDPFGHRRLVRAS
jgi:arylsulfatase